MHLIIKNKKLTARFIGLAILLLSSCGNKTEQTEAAAQAPPPSFPVITIETRNATLNTDFPASLQGEQNIEIRPKIDGYIEQIYIDEGSIVKKGQLLFRINAPQYAQEVNEAEAAINTAEADVSAAELQVNKTRPLVEKEIISHFELETAQFTLKSRLAALKQAKAKLANARTNLGYTKILSPVNGVVGSIPFKLGSLITASTAEPLTTISNIGKIYAYFSLNEKQLLAFSRTTNGNSMSEKIKNTPPVNLILSDGSNFPDEGHLETIAGLINTETGSASLRAAFANHRGLVRSGGSAVVRIPQTIEDAVLVPQKSTYELQGKRFVYIVDSGGKVKNTEIQVMDMASGQFFVVTSGLKAGDKIVLEGASSLQHGMAIKPEIKTSGEADQVSK